jgi:hypothetical protein
MSGLVGLGIANSLGWEACGPLSRTLLLPSKTRRDD